MAGVSRVEIKESAEELKALMHEQTRASSKERIQMLYLLKSGQAESIKQAAELLGRGRITLQRWMQKYEAGNIVGLLNQKPRPGAPCQIPPQAQAELVEKLANPTGFASYGEIQEWLKTEHQHEISYSGVHKHVHYRLEATPKRPRPVSRDQDPVKVSFFKPT